jgi:hypothetical protein
MRYKIGRVLWICVYGLLFSAACLAQGNLRVSEPAIRIQLLAESTGVELPVENAGRSTAAAEVDRSSLEAAVRQSGWEINHYDVLPDRVVVYLWPHAGGAKFFFTFRPRFGLKAQTSPSTLSDYYNPEAHAVVEPAEFRVGR